MAGRHPEQRKRGLHGSEVSTTPATDLLYQFLQKAGTGSPGCSTQFHRKPLYAFMKTASSSFHLPMHSEVSPLALAPSSSDHGQPPLAASTEDSRTHSQRIISDRRAATALLAQVRKTASAPLPQGRFASPSVAISSGELDHVALVDIQAPPADAADPVASPTLQQLARRGQLLLEYQHAVDRTLDLDHAVAAIKLRRAAEIYLPKSNLAKFLPRLPNSEHARQIRDSLYHQPIDDLLADLQRHPQHYSRTLLTDVATAHMMDALNIDVAKYARGIRAAACYEGLHSVAGRVVSTAAALVSLGVSELPGASEAIKILAEVVKILAHELPPNLINPFVTGRLRTLTDVKESFKRSGGQPVVRPEIDKSPDMGQIRHAAVLSRTALEQAITRFEQVAQGEDNTEALASLVSAFTTLHELMDRTYRRRIGLNRTQTYSKTWGMAVNGIGVAGALITATVPVAGQIAGPAILGAAIPLQWGAGYLDERRNRHRYNLRANVKWGDFLLPQAAQRHFSELTAADVSEAALRQSFITQPEIQVAAIREVYEDALATLIKEQLDLERQIAAGGSQQRPLAMLQRRSGELAEAIAAATRDIDDFESFDMAHWGHIPAEGLIGRCLDDLSYLEKRNRHARLRKPGESAQIVQRYVQAFQGGISTGTSLPIIDTISNLDSLQVPGDSHQLQPAALAGAATTGAIGGTVFTAATGEVRVSKAENKRILSATPPSAVLNPPRDDPRWSLQTANRRVDLRGTAAYRRFTYTRRDEFILLGRAVGHGLISGPVGLYNMARVRGWPQAEVARSRRVLRRALDALEKAGLPRLAPPGTRADTIAAMKDELYDYPAVRSLLGQPQAGQGRPT
jgi:hypothetical protein